MTDKLKAQRDGGMRKPSVAPEGVPVKIHSEIAWGIASHWSWALASSTRTLAGQIDEALAAERDALQATNAQLLEALEWQPIETAPKDGTMFLVCYPRMMNLVTRCWYDVVHKGFRSDEDRAGITRPVWFHKDTEHGDDVWMRIASPPTPSTVEDLV